ncbi:MAG: adenine deaminase [Rhizobiales bacterium]|nr:adenine deaminase [Hyphomicrobiales bacterium]MBO6697965.1 adenine deaminase [Hyphomicrobiales bacterium]MBO6735781.1 adenine deaminase [Hyphomicrobiales bacterium]MBO6913792.1 adenine deaminase [Hyphomicrobiales bacterium]MBO6956615.1 adenine deaminase [Hyphomicrobiales bacterium]
MREPHNLIDPDLRHRAVLAAQGKAPFDLLIEGGTLVDPVVGQLRPADIGIVGPLIASVHAPSEAGAFGADARIDATGLFLSPGLIDMHMHVESSMVLPAAYSNAVLPRGVTAAVWDPHEIANVAGHSGITFALDAAKAASLRFLPLAPSCVPSAPGFESTGADFDVDDLERLLARDDVHGVAEVMSMHALLKRTPRMAGIVQAGLESGKRVCGHARGLTGASLNAYVASGVQTDHELTSNNDLLAKLQAGLTIELRGSHDHLLPGFVETLNALETFPQTLTLCTDDVFPNDLHRAGGLDDVVRRLVRYGLPPIKALQAATLNAATQLGRRDLGLIAPGKRADIVLFENLSDFVAHKVVLNGTIVAEQGAMLKRDTTTTSQQALENTVKTPTFRASDFEIQASGKMARIATIKRPRFTAWGEREVPVRDGLVVCPDDMALMAVVNRYGDNASPRLALLEEWGTWHGAFATSVSHDSHNLTLFGRGAEDMALAANTVSAMQGGLAVVKVGEVIATLPLPVGGLMRDDDLAAVAEDFDSIVQAMDQVVAWQPPYLVFKACFGASLVCNAGPHLSDKGVVDTFEGIRLESVVLTD